MMRGEFFKAFLIGVLLIVLAGCNNTDTSENEKTEGQPTEDKATEQQQPSSQTAREPLAFDVQVVESADAGEQLTSEFGDDSPNYTMDNYLEYVITDVHESWMGRILDGGYGAPNGGYWFPSEEEEGTVETECGMAEEFDAFYCPYDDQIVITEKLAQQIWDGAENQFVGDFSAGLLVAHHYAHAMQANLGWVHTEPPAEGETHEPIVEHAALETHANCLAGIWAKGTYDPELLETQHIEQAINALSDIDDNKLGEGDSTASPEENIEAFNTGYDSGQSSDCDPYVFDAYNE